MNPPLHVPMKISRERIVSAFGLFTAEDWKMQFADLVEELHASDIEDMLEKALALGCPHTNLATGILLGISLLCQALAETRRRDAAGDAFEGATRQ